MTNSEVQFGELNLDFSSLVKNTEVLGFKTENKNKLKCKTELLELSSYWMQVLQVTERSSGSFPRVGEDDIQSSPELNLHVAIKPTPK